MRGYRFNLCPENSFYPGYYTEKCLHAKLSSSIPIYMSDFHVRHDFNPLSFINISDFQPLDNIVDFLTDLESNIPKALSIANEPLFHKTPCLDQFLMFLKMSVSRILV